MQLGGMGVTDAVTTQTASQNCTLKVTQRSVTHL